jgi:hypothetical protein
MQTLATIRLTTGLVILAGHFLSSFLLILFWLAGGYTFDEMLNVFAVIAPMFAAYLSLITTYAFRLQYAEHEEDITILATILSLVFPSSFVLLMAFAITLKAFNYGLHSIDNLIKFIGVIEVIMGSYTATVVRNLFPDHKPPTARAGRRPRN